MGRGWILSGPTARRWLWNLILQPPSLSSAVIADPSTLLLRLFPDPCLRQKAVAVTEFDANLAAVADRMIEMMFEQRGIGLAAPQVGLGIRMFVAHVPEDPEDEDRLVSTDPPGATAKPVVFVNPQIEHMRVPVVPYEEGCLSLPEIRGDVLRPELIRVRAQDVSGEPFEMGAMGLPARCIQHETDHLDGVLIIDKFTQLSRLKNRSAIKSLKRAAGEW